MAYRKSIDNSDLPTKSYYYDDDKTNECKCEKKNCKCKKKTNHKLKNSERPYIILADILNSVSYTHLDVYKRQVLFVFLELFKIQ